MVETAAVETEKPAGGGGREGGTGAYLLAGGRRGPRPGGIYKFLNLINT